MNLASLTIQPVAMPVLTGVFCAVGLVAEGGVLFRGARADGRWWRVAVAAAGVLLGAWVSFSAGPAGRLAVLCCLAGLWCIRSYRRTTDPVSAGRRGGLVALRLCVVAVVGLVGLRPVLRTVRVETSRPAVLLAVDTTASMGRVDAIVDGKPAGRLAAVGGQFRRQAGALARLADRAAVHVVTTSEGRFTPIDEPAELPAPSGSRTAMGDAVQAAFDAVSAGGGRVAAAVVLSDGCNNSARVIEPVALGRRLAGLGVRVHTVLVGMDAASAGARELAVAAVGVEEVLPAFRRVEVRPTVRAVGLAGRSVRLKARLGGETIGQAVRTVDGDDDRLVVRWSFVPRRVGFHRLSVSAEVLGEADPTLPGLAERSRRVQVIDRGLRILYVEGRFRYEARAVARALAGVERFELDRRLLTQPLRQGPPPLGESLEDWLGYHVILLGDVGPERFSVKQIELMRTLVGEYGKGLGMLGGRSSFGAGGWQDTPLADVLPVDVGRSAGQIDRPVKITPTPEGERSAWLAIGSSGQGVAAAWALLPALPGANRLGPLKPAATLQADTVRNEPMIVTQRYGKGRVAAVAFDTTWRWVLSPTETTAELQKRFWRQLVTYLADPQPNAWLETSRTTYDAEALARGAQEVVLTAGVEDARGRPAGLPPKVTLRGPDGSIRAIALQRDGRVYRAVLAPPEAEGLYGLQLQAEQDGRTLQAEGQFEVVRRHPETDTTWADARLMQQWASAGGGLAVRLGQLGALLEDVALQAEPLRKRIVDEVDLAGRFRWLLLLLLAGLVSAEWVLRRRSRLI